MSGPARGRQAAHAPLGMDGESFFLRRWLQPAASWTAGGIMAGHFSPAACRSRIDALADEMVKRAGFQRPAAEILDSTDMIGEEIQTIEARIDRLSDAIREEIRPMIQARAPRNFILAAAHDCNGWAGFLIRESDVNDIVRDAIRVAISPPRPEWKARQHG